MLPDYLNPTYWQKMKETSARLKAQMPGLVRMQCHAEEQKGQRNIQEEQAIRSKFEKRVSEIGLENALAEAEADRDKALEAAREALKSAIIYKK